MQSISKTLPALRQTCLLGRRTYFTTGARWKNIDNLVRRFLINSNGPKKKRRWYETNMLQNPTHLAQPQLKGEKNSHRLHVLNKVFLEKICDLLSTGRLSALFVGYGLEISRVQVAAGMTSVNVHWYCTGSDVDDNISKLLESSANHIRFELSKQNMIGRVPPILFVKDRRYYKIMEVERCLALADFGEDFVPSDPTHHVKTNLVLREELGDEITKALKITKENNEDFFKEALKLSASLSHEEEKIDLPSDLPVMRDEVLGVNTQKIFTLVKQSMTRARAEHRKVSNDSSFSQSTSFPSVSGAPRTEEIRQWVSKYKNLRKKQKQAKNLDDAYLSLPQYIDDDDDYNEEILPEEEKDYMEENFYFEMHEKT